MDIKWPLEVKSCENQWHTAYVGLSMMTDTVPRSCPACHQFFNYTKGEVNVANKMRSDCIIAYESAKKNAPGLVPIDKEKLKGIQIGLACPIHGFEFITMSDAGEHPSGWYDFCAECANSENESPELINGKDYLVKAFGTPVNKPTMSEEKIIQAIKSCSKYSTMSYENQYIGVVSLDIKKFSVAISEDLSNKALANHFTASAVNVVWPEEITICQHGSVDSKRLCSYCEEINSTIDDCTAAHAKAQTVDVGKLVEALEDIASGKLQCPDFEQYAVAKARKALQSAKRGGA